MSVFKVDYTVMGKIVCKTYTAVVNAVSLDRDVRVVIVDLEDPGRKRQVRKVFFSTDTTMSARDISDYISDILNKTAALPPGSPIEAYRNLLPDKWTKDEQGQ